MHLLTHTDGAEQIPCTQPPAHNPHAQARPEWSNARAGVSREEAAQQLLSEFIRCCHLQVLLQYMSQDAVA